MKVLLCTPFNINPRVVQGGIAIWAQNIFGYYESLSENSDLNLQILPLDRKERDIKYSSEGLINRIWHGIVDYHAPIKRTNKRLKNEHFDVLHLCTSASISLSKDILLLCIAKFRNVRTVIHFHFGRIPELSIKQNWEWKLLKCVIRLADATITMDMKSFEILKTYGFKKIYYVPNPLSPKIMDQINKESSSTPIEKRKICFVGHVIPTKGCYELVEACKDIRNIKLNVVGKVAPKVYEKMRQIAGQNEWLVFKGEIDHRDVIREMLSSEVFVLPTYTEGFPNVIIEAMACGCAIVATPVGAIPEMLEDEGNQHYGLLVEPKNVKQLHDAILKMLESDSLKNECRDNVKGRVSERYNMSIVWKSIVDIWNNVLK